MQTLPVARLVDAVLPVMRTVVRRDLPGLVVVEQQETGVLGVVTAGRLLEVLVDAAAGEPPR